ncbi:MAG: hypothetical protein JST16_01180 [Bdellovibrionales bacterium]|nr:hypothetical protein [Bdellovibrionales bacterium]
MGKVLKLFLGAGLVASVGSLAAEPAAQKWVCKQNKSKTSELVNKKLKEHPEARNRSGDDGAIEKSSLESFNLTISPDGVVSGSVDGYEKWSVPSSSRDFDVTVSKVKTGREGGYNGFYINADGWDHFSYGVRLYPETKTASVRESFDFDCGGNGSLGYAVYDCKVTDASL